MQTVVLGRTGLKVSVVALGAGGSSKLGQAHGASVQDSIAIVRTALDLGVNFLDTAAVYGTEAIIGQAIRGRRDETVISTKVLMTETPKSKTLIDGDALRQRIEGSLLELSVDYVDILHLHGLTPQQYEYAVSEFLPIMEDLRDEGKIRFTGVSERFAIDTKHEMLARAATEVTFDVFMIGYNFVNQTARRQVLPTTQKNKIGTMCMYAVRGPLARLETANALVHKLVKSGEIDPKIIDQKDPLGFLLEPGVSETLSEAAYRFCRHTPGIDVVVTGTGNQDHLQQNLKAIQMDRLPHNALEKLEQIFARVELETGDP